MLLSEEKSRLLLETIEDAILYHKDKLNFNQVREIQQLQDELLEEILKARETRPVKFSMEETKNDIH